MSRKVDRLALAGALGADLPLLAAPSAVAAPSAEPARDFRPLTDPTRPDVRAGFQVEAIDLATGRRETFARNRGEGPPRPASELDLETALERPVDVKVGPDGLVYVLDFGVYQTTADSARVLPKTGKVFRIEPASPE